MSELIVIVCLDIATVVANKHATVLWEWSLLTASDPFCLVGPNPLPPPPLGTPDSTDSQLWVGRAAEPGPSDNHHRCSGPFVPPHIYQAEIKGTKQWDAAFNSRVEIKTCFVAIVSEECPILRIQHRVPGAHGFKRAPVPTRLKL